MAHGPHDVCYYRSLSTERLVEEAKYNISIPLAQAMAERLEDTVRQSNYHRQRDVYQQTPKMKDYSA